MAPGPSLDRVYCAGVPPTVPEHGVHPAFGLRSGHARHFDVEVWKMTMDPLRRIRVPDNSEDHEFPDVIIT